MEKTLWGLHYQTCQDFEVIIADDGSGAETARRIACFKQQSGCKIKHVWQPDVGFQKTRILNKALLQSEGEYIVFTDGYCILRTDFLAAYLHYRQPGYFLSGGYFKLPIDISKVISKSDIASGRAMVLRNWLGERAVI